MGEMTDDATAMWWERPDDQPDPALGPLLDSAMDRAINGASDWEMGFFPFGRNHDGHGERARSTFVDDLFETTDWTALRNLPRAKAAPDTVWKMRDGTRIAMADMKYSHLCNTLRMLRRNWNLERYRNSCPRMYFSNGDMAQLGLDQEWEAECDRRRAARGMADEPAFVGLAREHTMRLIALRQDVKRQRYWAGVRAGTEFFV